MQCSALHSEFVGMNVSFRNFARPATEIESEIICWLRAPWEIAHFDLVEEDDKTRVLDKSGVPITEHHFKRWMQLNHPNYHKHAVASKPSEFLKVYPTWGDQGYPTDMFSAMFADTDRVPLSQSHVNRNLHLAKSITLDLSAFINLSKNNEKGDPGVSFPAGQDIFDTWYENGIVALGGEDHLAPAWDNRYRWSVWSEMDGFDTAAATLSRALFLLGRSGFLMPFDFRTIPGNTTGHRVMTLMTHINFTVAGLINVTTTPRIVFDLNPSQDASTFRFSDLDFTRYLAEGTNMLHNSCLALNWKTGLMRSNGVPDLITTARTKMARLLQDMSKSYFSIQSVAHSHKDLEDRMIQEQTTLMGIGKLLHTQNNLYLEQSEGFLQMEASRSRIGVLLDEMMARNLVAEDQYRMLKVTFDEVDWTKLVARAQEVGLYKDAFANAPRPLPLYEKDRLGKIIQQSLDLQERQRNPEMPVWGIVTLVVLAVFVFAMLGLVLYVSKK